MQSTLFSLSQKTMDDIVYFCRFYFDPQSFILYNLILIVSKCFVNGEFERRGTKLKQVPNMASMSKIA